jgi:hypothetical protein
MINPALEYLTRNPGIVRLDLPCSFMAHGVNGHKKVVAVHPIGNCSSKVHAKVWHLDRAQPMGLLPPVTSEEYPVESLSTPWHFFPQGIKPLGYTAEFPAVASNKTDRPIPQGTYDVICGNMFFSQSHRENRERFLWDAFERTFPKSNLRLAHHPSWPIRKDSMVYEPRLHQYWGMWKTHMLNFASEVAPELYYWATSVSSSSSASTSGQK